VEVCRGGMARHGVPHGEAAWCGGSDALHTASSRLLQPCCATLPPHQACTHASFVTYVAVCWWSLLLRSAPKSLHTPAAPWACMGKEGG
jgi:hypothetical protein